MPPQPVAEVQAGGEAPLNLSYVNYYARFAGGGGRFIDLLIMAEGAAAA